MELLVDDVKSEAVSGALHLGDQVAQLLDGLDLLFQEVLLEVVAEVRVVVTPGNLVESQERLVDALLQLQGGLDRAQGASPLAGDGLGDVLEDDPAASLVLVLDQVVGVLALLLGLLGKVLGKTVKGLVVAVEKGGLETVKKG